jgi:HAD superfamily hydrolase (TIGR01490 family)
MNLTLFDLDGTLLPTDSDHAFGEFLIELGWADGTLHRQRNDAFYADYQAGRLDMAAYVEFATRPWRERPADALAEAQARFLRQVVQPALHPAALQLVQSHREQGDLMAVVTATNEFVTRPIAALFGIDVLIATELEHDEAGRPTGAIAGQAAFREGKIARVEAWLAAQGRSLASFGQSTFYSDSTNDLPLLEHVSHPVATNPSPALERHARERGWPVLKLFE